MVNVDVASLLLLVITVLPICIDLTDFTNFSLQFTDDCVDKDVQLCLSSCWCVCVCPHFP